MVFLGSPATIPNLSAAQKISSQAKIVQKMGVWDRVRALADVPDHERFVQYTADMNVSILMLSLLRRT